MAKLDGLEQDRVDKLFEALDRFSGRELMPQGTVKVTKRGYDVFLSISTSEVISITKFSAGKWGVYSSKVGGGGA